MAKKSLFERMGLVQSIEEETEVAENVLCENVPEEELEVAKKIYETQSQFARKVLINAGKS